MMPQALRDGEAFLSLRHAQKKMAAERAAISL
jgi:hypothetical protein